jgi:putative RNA 2'-phosphotransferase
MAYDKRLSKFLSLALRHEPEVLGLTLDPDGYVGVGELVRALRKNGYPTLMGVDLESLVAGNDKRFAFNEDRTLIRASQGHSVPVDREPEP